MSKTITVPKVDIAALRVQRNLLLELREKMKYNSKKYLILSGNIHLLDAMLDIAEGYYLG
tara:strand:- start:337 stop:516 length:180 start_codon:yes stop_codon:yes gene_type:complete